MAKRRYHETKHDKMVHRENLMGSHSRPMPNVVSKMKHSEGYAGYEHSKSMMHRDSGLIHEDHSAPCNLPTGVIDRYFPNAYEYMNESITSLFTGAQIQLKEDGMDRKKETNPKKY